MRRCVYMSRWTIALLVLGTLALALALLCPLLPPIAVLPSRRAVSAAWHDSVLNLLGVYRRLTTTAAIRSSATESNTSASDPAAPSHTQRSLDIGILWTGRDTYSHMALRSLLLFRTCPLTFHLLVDDAGAADARAFFNSTQIHRMCSGGSSTHTTPGSSSSISGSFAHSSGQAAAEAETEVRGPADVVVRYYPVAHYAHFLRGTKSTFSSAVCSIRLFVDQILPLEFVVMIDLDMLFVGDVCLAHYHLDEMRRDDLKTIAMAPELTTFHKLESTEKHLHRLKFRYPRGTLYGVNGGVVFFYLERMRQHNWTARVKPFVYGTDLVLGDQVPLNEFAALSPPALHHLSPGWNFQLYEMPVARIALSLLGPGEDFIIVHGNGKSFRYWLFPYEFQQPVPVLCGGNNFTVVQTRIAQRLQQYHA